MTKSSGGTTAFASKRVAEERHKVKFMYREDPRSPGDSGWKFFRGDESQEYVDNPINVGEYPLDSITNIDPSVVPLLDTPAPCAFERNSDEAEFVSSEFYSWLEE